MIQTIKGEMKIEDIMRGTKIYCEGSYLPVSRVIRSSTKDIPLVIIKKDTFGENIPHSDIICNEHHIFWIFDDVTNYRRVTAKKLISESKASYYDNKCKRLYNLQFDEETSFIVNNIRCDAVSPYYIGLPLARCMYIDKSKYTRILSYEQHRKNKIPHLEC